MLYNAVALNEIEDITAEQVRDYAAQRGWQPVPSRREDVLLMRHPNRKVSEIALPMSSEFVDYREAIVIAVSRLAVYLEQPVSTVIHDIVMAGDTLASTKSELTAKLPSSDHLLTETRLVS